MSHPGAGLDKFEDLKNATAIVSKGALTSYYAWLREAYGFKDENVKPYNYNSATFIADKHSIQEGYVTSEPFEVERQGGFKPNVFLLADYGYSSYATTDRHAARNRRKKSDLVQRFVDASTIGWYHYLYGDNAKANEAIKHDNPEMTTSRSSTPSPSSRNMASSFRRHPTKGIGAMTDAQVKDFFDKMVEAGVVEPDDRLQRRSPCSSSTRASASNFARSEAVARLLSPVGKFPSRSYGEGPGVG